MPLLFKNISDLLQALEDNAANTKKALNGWLDQRNRNTIESWVKLNNITIHSASVDVVAVLSALFPDKRTDRVYSLKPPSLSKILGRCFKLGSTRRLQLEEWKAPGRGDLGLCVERTLRETEPHPVISRITLDEVDSTLLAIAAKNRFSAPKVRETAADNAVETSKQLESIYLRLSSNEAKWMTRMILKDYPTLDFKSYHVLNTIHPRLKQALDVHSNFEAAVGLLRHQEATAESQAQPRVPLRPMIGSKIGRVPFLKGRSIKNVVQLVAGRKMSVERKYDGEYCQIHINLAQGEDCVQLFSNSGKDSTADRHGVHEAIKQSLRIGQADCQFSQKCILEGELLVFNDVEGTISEFHKIRKLVTRSGASLGTELDSQAYEHEHLMISYYDLMLVDDDVVMNEPHTDRRRRLQKLVTCIPGRAKLSKQRSIDFASSHGPEQLRYLLSHAFAQRWEGLVLKPSNAPYANLQYTVGNSNSRCWIKLKKDYIPGLGDTADFAVVGAGYDAARAAQLQEPAIKWTHFHLGCLRNKKEVITQKATPYFAVVTALTVNREMAKHLNQHGQFVALPLGSLLSYSEPFVLDVPKSLIKMDVVFQKPFVLDVMGAGFDKEPSRGYFTLRFPRALRIHGDRNWKACVGFDELQGMAKVARTVSEDTKTEVAEWMEQLDQVDRGAKGSSVPWDLSDDDIEISEETALENPAGEPTSRRNRTRSSAVAPMVRMDTAEMTEQEQRLDSGEVVRKPTPRSPISGWSDSNLPSPAKSLPAPDTSAQHSSRALSSMQSSNSIDGGRRRSSDDTENSPRYVLSKRARVSPPVRIMKGAGTHTNSRPSANGKTEYVIPASGPVLRRQPSTHPIPQPKHVPAQESFLVPKLSVGAAEALRSHIRPTVFKANQPTSPDRQTTQDERSTEDEVMSTQHSTQEALVAEWVLPEPMPTPLSAFRLPNLQSSPIVLGPDVSGMPYLTTDILGSANIQAYLAHDVLIPSSHKIKLGEVSDSRDGAPQDVIFLIEGRRHHSSLEMLTYLIGYVPEDGSKVVWVFDWRLAEEVLTKGIQDEGYLMGKRLMARYRSEVDGTGELRWFSNLEKLHTIPRIKIEESRRMDGRFLAKGGRMSEHEPHPDPQALTSNPDPSQNASTDVDYTPHPESSIKVPPEREAIVKAITNLYSGSASKEDVEVYAEKAVYDDPWSFCDTRYKIAGQWYGIPKVFTSSRTLATEIVLSSPDTLSWKQTQEYTPKLLHYSKAVNSLVTCTLDAEGKVVYHKEQWNHKDYSHEGLGKVMKTLNGDYLTGVTRPPKDL
ncbi:MAG: hypothetical protein Q9194_003995 [Teloschistes cf. exilis]